MAEQTKTTPARVRVRFNREHSATVHGKRTVYAAGEAATLPADVADPLVKAGVARKA